MSRVAIRAEGLSKSYRLGETVRYKALRDVLTRAVSSPLGRLARRASRESTPPPLVWALSDLSFEVQEGEAVGVIGRNGAGKSTLFRILSRVTFPTSGHASIRGRTGSLLEVGTGFHPELTGRQNVYLNGAILGMPRREIDQRFDEIVEFAEIARFLDTAVKYYSTGMYLRLAFSVAAHLEPDILLVDEVLAVGDAAFQRKCLGKMAGVASQGRTILFVSHDMGAIHALTSRSLYLQEGRLKVAGPTPDVVRTYLTDVVAQRVTTPGDVSPFRRNPSRETPVRFTRVWIGEPSDVLPTLAIGAPVTLSMEIEADRSIHGANLTVTLKDSRGQRIAVFFSWDRDFSLFLAKGRHVISLQVEGLPLAPGQYHADVGLNQAVQTSAYDVLLDVPLFVVENEGHVLHWLERPWGVLHWTRATWSQRGR